MGTMFAMELADGSMDLHSALHYHLSANHYPPVPDSMIEPCVEAIDAYFEEDYDRPIDLNGNLWRNQTTAPAHAIVEAHHLGCFLDQDDDY